MLALAAHAGVADETPAPVPSPTPSSATDNVPLPVPVNSCSALRVATVDKLSSANARPGDLFHFKTLDPIEINASTVVPEGAVGVGVVSVAKHAERGGVGGFLALDPRYVMLPDGTHVEALIDRSVPSLSPTGRSNNVPGLLGIIPLAGYVLGPYDFLHHGSDVTIAPGTSFRILVGDLDTISKCRANS